MDTNTLVRGVSNVADQAALLLNCSALELLQEADDILRDAGYNRWGRENSDRKQARFEHCMPTGAYIRDSERRKA
jgi:hypothetical protein